MENAIIQSPLNATDGAVCIAITPEAILNKWADFAAVKPQSLKTYKRALKNFFEFLGGRDPRSATRADLKEYADSYLLSKKPSTRSLYIQSVKLFFKFCAAEGFFNNAAADHIKVKGSRSKEFKKDFLTKDAARALLKSKSEGKSAISKRDYAILALMLTAGLRTCEVARADVKDFQLFHGERILWILGKGRDEKTEYVKIPPAVEKIIFDYLRAREIESGRRLNENDPLFSTHGKSIKGGRLSTRSLSFLAKEALKAAGFESDRLTAHSLRHTAAVLNLESGASLEETRQLLRHDSIKTTQIYSHAVERLNNHSEKRIAAALFGVDGANED